MIILFNDFISVYIQNNIYNVLSYTLTYIMSIMCCYSCLIMPEKTNETYLSPQVLLSYN